MRYDPNFKKSPDGQKLYDSWRNITKRGGRCKEWDDFGVFCKWAIANGHKKGTQLKRFDTSKPFSPDNCYVHECDGIASEKNVCKDWCDLWNKTVNRIRAHYGMEPVGVSNG